MVVEGVCILVVLIGRLGRHGAAFAGMLNEVPVVGLFCASPWWGGDYDSKNIKNRNPEIQPKGPLAMGAFFDGEAGPGARKWNVT